MHTAHPIGWLSSTFTIQKKAHLRLPCHACHLFWGLFSRSVIVTYMRRVATCARVMLVACACIMHTPEHCAISWQGTWPYI